MQENVDDVDNNNSKNSIAQKVIKKDRFSYSSIKRLFAGQYHSFIITKINGKFALYGWGLNQSNILCLGEYYQLVPYPSVLESFSGKFVYDIDSGLNHALCLCSSNVYGAGGKVYSWGLGNLGRLGYSYTGETEGPLDPMEEEDWYTDKPHRVKVPDHPNCRFARVVCGDTFSILLSTHGEIFSFGYSSKGALGLGETDLTWCPRKINIYKQDNDIVDEEFIIDVSAGSDHVICVTRSGSVYVWGNNSNGQLGLGNIKNYSSPEILTCLANEIIVSCSAGSSHSALVTVTGHVYTWGSNFGGKLGLGDDLDKNEPTLVGSITSVIISSVKCSVSSTFFLAADGDLYRCGSGVTVQSSFPILFPTKFSDLREPVINVAVGSSHCLIAYQNGDLYCWGQSDNGKLGLNDEENHLTITSIPEFRGSIYVDDIVKRRNEFLNLKSGKKLDSISKKNFKPFEKVVFGDNFSLLLTRDGKIYGTGSNDSYQLGFIDDSLCLEEFKLLQLPQTEKFINIACGNRHSLCLAASGNLYVSGSNKFGQLGFNQKDFVTEFSLVNYVPPTVYCSAASDYSIIICHPRSSNKDDTSIDYGEIYLTGRSIDGNLIYENDLAQFRRYSEFSSFFKKIACGENHVIALTDENKLYSWGNGAYGKLGLGNESNCYLPFEIKIVLENKVYVDDIAVGKNHSICLTSKGDVYVWGHKDSIGALKNISSPVNYTLQLVSKDLRSQKVIAISSGSNHCGAIIDTKIVILWGQNTHAQLTQKKNSKSDGQNQKNSKTLRILENIENVVSLSLGRNSSIIGTKSGEVMVWGQATNGILGIGDCQLNVVENPTNVEVFWNLEFTENKDTALDELENDYTKKYDKDHDLSEVSSNVDYHDIYTRIMTELNPNISILHSAMSKCINDKELEQLYVDCQKLYSDLFDDIRNLYKVNTEFSEKKKIFKALLHQSATKLGIAKQDIKAISFAPDLNQIMPYFDRLCDIVKILYLQPGYFIILSRALASQYTEYFIDLMFSLFTVDENDYICLFVILSFIAEDEAASCNSDNLTSLFYVENSLFLNIFQKLINNNFKLLNLIASPIISYTGKSDSSIVESIVNVSLGMISDSFLWFCDSIEDYINLIITNKEYIQSQEAEVNRANPEFVVDLDQFLADKELVQSTFESIQIQITKSFEIWRTNIERFIYLDSKIIYLISFINDTITKYGLTEKTDYIEKFDHLVRFYLCFVISPLLYSYPYTCQYIGTNAIDDIRHVNNINYMGRLLSMYCYYEETNIPEKYLNSIKSFCRLLCFVFNQQASNYDAIIHVEVTKNLFEKYLENIIYPSITMLIPLYPLLIFCQEYYIHHNFVRSLNSFDPILKIIEDLKNNFTSKNLFENIINYHMEKKRQNDCQNPAIKNDEPKENAQTPQILITFNHLVLLNDQSILYDPITSMPVSQDLLMKSVDNSTNNDKIKPGELMLIKPYQKEVNSYVLIFEAICLCKDISAKNILALIQQLESYLEYFIQINAPKKDIDTISKALKILNIEKDTSTVVSILTFGANFLQKKRVLQIYYNELLKLRPTLLQKLELQCQQLIKMQKNLTESLYILDQLEIDSTHASITTALDRQPLLWMTLNNDDSTTIKKELKYTLHELNAYGLIKKCVMSRDSQISFYFRQITTEFSEWDISFGNIVKPFELYFEKNLSFHSAIEIIDGKLDFYYGPLCLFLENFVFERISITHMKKMPENELFLD